MDGEFSLKTALMLSASHQAVGSWNVFKLECSQDEKGECRFTAKQQDKVWIDERFPSLEHCQTYMREYDIPFHRHWRPCEMLTSV